MGSWVAPTPSIGTRTATASGGTPSLESGSGDIRRSHRLGRNLERLLRLGFERPDEEPDDDNGRRGCRHDPAEASMLQIHFALHGRWNNRNAEAGRVGWKLADV
jgi:hypothetical protein